MSFQSLRTRSSIWLGAIVCLTLFVAPTASPATAHSPSTEPFVDGTVLVGFQPGTRADKRHAVAASVGATEVDRVGAGTHVLRVPKGQVLDKITALKANPNIRYAEPDYILRADAGGSWTPNDPYFTKLWGMKMINASAAWASTMGASNVVVGVVDTGVDYTHPDLKANIWSSTSTINGCPAGTHGYNTLTLACDPMDDNHHGTHISGTIGAVGNNGIGVIGVSPTVKIMGLKFLNSTGSGSSSGAIAAIEWAIKAKQAGTNVRVLSNSWGGGSFSQALLDEINKAGANDILFVVAAGNNSSSDDATPFYPCSYHTANEICVAATDSRDGLATFSNYGANSVDLAAPGVSILSTVPGGGYDSYSGTSMATPHVSGAAALALSTGYQSVWTLKSTLLAAVDPLGALAGRVATGGRLNVCKAIFACGGVEPPPPPPPPPSVGDFSLSTADSRQMVSPGESTAYAATVTPSGGFVGQVALSIGGLPSGATASFTPTPLGISSTTSVTSIITVSVDPATPPGTYTLTIVGTCGSLTHNIAVDLRVKRS